MKTLGESAVSFQVVLTKADAVKPDELRTRIRASEQEIAKHPAAFPQVVAVSARTGAGIAELRAAIARLVAER